MLTNSECFDRMELDYCKHFVQGTDIWETGVWTCDGKSAPVAFRVCRQSCGYCSVGMTKATVAATSWTLANAQDAAQCRH
jgi:hypothetical protein